MNQTPQELLKTYFGYDTFRPGQEEIITHILNKEDALGIMPTGAGKSICYQIPALTFSGITLVISPLISLMKDQVDTLNQIGISSTYLNSSLSENEYIQTIENICHNVYKIVYIAPERFLSDTFINMLNFLDISMIAIDEAHCVSQWGHDFRPSYTQINNIVSTLQKRPVLVAFTATATELVKNDIINLLNLRNPFVLTTGFDRKNLYFSVETPKNKNAFLSDFLKTHKNLSGIIYCSTRKTVDNLYEKLSSNYIVSKYHGGMSEKQRSISQEDFVYDKTNIMIATNAFGMGIDKSNVRYVIHYNMPRDLESYYQEAGRAGRDGDNAECILLFNRADVVTNKFLIEQTPSDSNHSNEYKKLNNIIDYCNTDECLRSYILKYFGETPKFDKCNSCSNCNYLVETTDITLDSKKILSCIKRMHERFGAALVCDVLKGCNTSKIRSFGFNNLSTYGIMSDYSKDTIRDLISFLVAEGYLKNVGDRYPFLVLTDLANNVLFKNQSVFIKKKIEKIAKPEKESNSSSTSNSRAPSVIENLSFDSELFEILRELRSKIAKSHKVPPFVIFSDIALKQMAAYLPTPEEDFLNISGVGNFKLENYGDIFMDVIRDYVKNHKISIEPDITKIQKVKTKKEDTKKITYHLFVDEAKSIKEIADIRNLSVSTIENHLLACLEEGMEIDLEGLVHTNFEDEIISAIESCGSQRLRPIKDVLPEEVSYFDIRYYLIKSRKNNLS